MTSILIAFGQFCCGLIHANFGEWLMHRYIFHGLGENPKSVWAYHLHDHHARCLAINMVDSGYRNLDLLSWNAQSKEFAVLTGIVLFHVPLYCLSPIFVIA
jgi:hypothetical protein